MQDESLLLEASLERAAETLGDITAPVMARFYEAWPEALPAFEHHGLGARQRLETAMVDTALYCATNWLDRPMEITIQLNSSVPHHQDTLKIELPWYRGLLEAVVDVIAETIPADQPAELAIWKRIRGELGALIEASHSTYGLHASAAA
jgi:hypothetical protein